MTPIFFASLDEMYAWMLEHHATRPELFVGYHKKRSTEKGIDHVGAVGVALCFGWIDSVQRPIDDLRYAIRFTPRKANSVWSQVNLKRVAALKEAGLMQESGIAAYEARKPELMSRYSFEQESVEFTPEQDARFCANKAAWAYFDSTSPSYKRQATWHVISAKRDETKDRRLETLIELSAAGEKLPHLSKYVKKAGE